MGADSHSYSVRIHQDSNALVSSFGSLKLAGNAIKEALPVLKDSRDTFTAEFAELDGESREILSLTAPGRDVAMLLGARLKDEQKQQREAATGQGATTGTSSQDGGDMNTDLAGQPENFEDTQV